MTSEPPSNLIRVTIGGAPTRVEARFQDPICKMLITKDEAAVVLNVEAETHYFCHLNCAVRFSREGNLLQLQNLSKYLHASEGSKDETENSKSNSESDSDTDSDQAEQGFVCPMHPQVLETKQVPCPLCGMALDPISPQTEEDDSEYKDMLARLKLASLFTVPVAVLGMSSMQAGHNHSNMSNLLMLALSTPVLYIGAPFFSRALSSIKNLTPNMFTLIGTGVLAAWGYSTFVTIIDLMVGKTGTETYFESSAVIISLALFGQVLELKARKATGTALKELINLVPKSCRLILRDNSLVEIDYQPEKLERGDRLAIKPGESIPCDAIVVQGQSSVEEAMLTGETLPAEKEPGGIVFGGTTNGRGQLEVIAIKSGRQSLISRIIKLVAQAQRSRAPVQDKVDRVAAYFVPTVFAISILTFFIWSRPEQAMALVNSPVYPAPLSLAVAVLIIACPCALGLATPMSVTVALGLAARRGLLIKDARTLEELSRIDTLILDKTGTLTTGKFKVSVIEPTELDNQPNNLAISAKLAIDDYLLLLASLESASEHPLGQAIYNEAKSRNLEPVKPLEAKALPGGGIEGRVPLGDKIYKVRAGNEKYINITEKQNGSGESTVYLEVDGQVVLHVGLVDEIKPDCREALQYFHDSGVKLVMLTGDNERAAKQTAESLGDIFDQVRARQTPEEKYQFLQSLKRDNKKVAMVGDGINDSPALALADVGIAMGTGTSIAMEAAPIVILSGSLKGLTEASRLSQALNQNIKENLLLAFGYNSLAVPIAAGLLIPIWGIKLNPMIASLTMSLSSFSVIANALRLKLK